MATMGEFWDQRWSGGQDVHAKHRNALRLFQPEDRGKVIGDFGCGPGVFLNLLVAAGFPQADLRGIDVSAEACEACRRAGFQTFHGEFSAFPEKVDVAVLIDVLEHIFDPDAFFDWLRGASRESVIAVPNFSSAKQRLEMAAGRVPYQNKVGRGGHVFFTNRPVLLAYFRRHGLQVVRESHVYPGNSRGSLGALAGKAQNAFPNLFAAGLGFRLKTT
jgi:trans-aconitate methyltransferase